MKQVMKYTAVIGTTLAIFYILWQFKLVLLLFVLSLFVAATIRPFVNWLVAHKFSTAMAQLLLYVVGIGGILLVLLLTGDWLLQEVNSAVNWAMVEYESLHHQWQNGLSWQQTAVELLPPPFTLSAAEQTDLQEMLPIVVEAAQGISGVMGGLLLVLALSIYWSVDQHRFERLWLSLLPVKQRAYARDSWREIETAVGRYLRSQTVQSVLAALFLGVGAAVSGMAFPLLLAVFGGLAAFVPLFGGLVTAGVAYGIGSLHSQWVGLGTAVYTLALFLGLELWVEPRFWGRERRSFLLTILVIVPLVEAFGLWGLVVAPPFAAALEVLISQAYQAYLNRSQTAVQLDKLEERYHQLTQKMAETNTPELQNLSKRLADLLADSRELGSAS
ncbi:MAG: AI-2E family transporter [Anaerolineales bacterium]|nr:AI-2E family transporter [Anaerolineales bacterium]